MTHSAVHSPIAPVQPPPKRYRVGELVEHTGLTRQTLHNYARWGLIEAVAVTRGGHRLYDEGVFGRLAEVARLKGVMSMREIRQRLNSQGTD